jgi:hypothetical protein
VEPDSVIYGYSFSFVDSTKHGAEKISIAISKIFKISELSYNKKRNGNFIRFGNLSKDEFISVFQQTYEKNNYYSGIAGRTSIISMGYRDYSDNHWNTTYTPLFLHIDSISNFYNDSKFSINDIQVLDDDCVVIEGAFDVKIFNWYSGKYIRFKDGYFKGYKRDI